MTKLCWLLVLLLSVASVGWAADPAPVTAVRYLFFQVYDLVPIAQANGCFTKAALSVPTVQTHLAGPTAIQAVHSRGAEVGITSVMALINAVAAGLDVAGFADVQSERIDSPKEVFLVKAASGIKTLADLKGRTLAINLVKSSFHYTYRLALLKANLQEGQVRFVTLPFAQQAQALVGGQVDVVGLMEPYASAAERTYPGQLRRLFTGADIFGYRQFSVYFARRSWLTQERQIAWKFDECLSAAADWTNANPEAANLIVSEKLGINPKAMPLYTFQPHAGLVPADLTYWIDTVRTLDGLEAPLTAGDLYVKP